MRHGSYGRRGGDGFGGAGIGTHRDFVAATQTLARNSGGLFTGALQRPSPRINAGAPTGSAAIVCNGRGLIATQRWARSWPGFSTRALRLRFFMAARRSLLMRVG